MSDLISREAAIEALFDWEMTYDWDDHCREEDPKPAYIVSPSDVIEQLPSAQPEQQWIPVSERLPEDGKYVLVTTAEGNVTDAKYWQRERIWVKNWAVIRVIAWMPLPKPWRGTT